MDLIEHSEPFSHIANSQVGVILIHGFTSTTSSMKYLADKFAEAEFHVELPCLPGHGTTWQVLEKTKYWEWLQHLKKTYSELKKRADKIFLCGLSMGGGLALRMAEIYPEINGLILINHACKFTHLKFKFVPIVKRFVRSVAEIRSDIKTGELELGYDRTPTEGVHQMLLLLKEVRRNLPKVKQPVLMFKSREDHVIPIESTTYTAANISSKFKKIIWLNNSYHVATMDNDKDIIAEKSIEFIQKIVE